MSQSRAPMTSAMQPSRQPVRTGKKELVADNHSKKGWLKKKKKSTFPHCMANRYLHGKRKTSNSDSALVSWSLISQQYLKVHEYWKNLLSLQRETEAENSKELFILLYGLLRDISTRSWHQKSIISPKELAYRAQNVTHPSLLCSHKQAPSPISDPLPINIKMIRSFFQFGHLAPAVISPYFFLISLFLSFLYNSLNH